MVSRRSEAMKALFILFAKDQSGAAAIECGLIVAGIAVAIIFVVAGVGPSLYTTFTDVQTEFARSGMTNVLLTVVIGLPILIALFFIPLGHDARKHLGGAILDSEENDSG
jgi:pilus assembly protein Flp/PilA